MYDVLNLFLHVVFAFFGFILWTLGSLILIVMETGRFTELRKQISILFVIGGSSFFLMQIFGGFIYQAYYFEVEPFLVKNFPYLSDFFNLKLILTSLATVFGFGTAAAAWIAQNKKEVYLTMGLALGTLMLFAVCAYIAIIVTTTYSI